MILRWIERNSNLLLRLSIFTLLQLAILTYVYLGQKLVAYYENDRSFKFNCSILILQRLSEIDVIKAIVEISYQFAITLVIQVMMILGYSFCRSLRSKRIAAIAIWFAPTILFFGSQFLMGIYLYLISPLAIIHFLWEVIDINSYCRAKNFYPGEGLMYSMALEGLFNLFWLTEIIKNWISSKPKIR
jgi:hypothetical protein